MTDKFEDRIRELTKPINGQLPRPWMTSMEDPLQAEVFIVGMNQSREYPVDQICHRRHVDALFNRNRESCRGLYNEVTDGRPSRTRRNIDELSGSLKRQGIHRILETNVICYSTRMSRDLRTQAHAGGAKMGDDIFRYLLEQIHPPVIIVHGARAGKKLSAILGKGQLKMPRSAGEVCDVLTEKHLVIPIPSLSPPAFNGWLSWSGELMDQVAARVRLARRE